MSTFVVADHDGILIHGRYHVTSYVHVSVPTRGGQTVVRSDDHLPTDAGDCESIPGWVANGNEVRTPRVLGTPEFMCYGILAYC